MCPVCSKCVFVGLSLVFNHLMLSRLKKHVTLKRRKTTIEKSSLSSSDGSQWQRLDDALTSFFSAGLLFRPVDDEHNLLQLMKVWTAVKLISSFCHRPQQTLHSAHLHHHFHTWSFFTASDRKCSSCVCVRIFNLNQFFIKLWTRQVFARRKFEHFCENSFRVLQ